MPGEDYTAVIGEDLCALGESFADVLNTGVGTGEVGMLGGTPGNALSASVGSGARPPRSPTASTSSTRRPTRTRPPATRTG